MTVPLDVDAPGVGGHLEVVVHGVRDGLAVWQDLRQVLGAQHITQCGGGQQSRGVAEKQKIDVTQLQF